MLQGFNRASGWSCLLFAGFLALLSGAQPAWGESTIAVSLDQPDPFTPAHGMVRIEAVVVADEPITRVAFYVDSVVVGELTEPPYHLEIDVGDDNQEHRFQVVAYGVSGATGSGVVTTPKIRVDEEVSITLQQLYVTATRDGEPVLDLGRDDFAVIDRNLRQNLITFTRGNIPFTALVLLDASVSMEGQKLADALAGAEAFFAGMRPLDEGKLLAFSDRILHSTPFTTISDVLAAGLDRIRATGGTALNDHLYLALKQLQARQGRRVVILLSDGVDSHSVLPMNDVLRNARRSQALIYWLQLPYRRGGLSADGSKLPKIASTWRRPDDYQREFSLLRRTVEESGGRVQLLASTEEIADAFASILTELREQYALGFYPEKPNHDGRWRRLKVRVRPAGVDLRYREGYLDF
ncbi:MAG: VWA domain-containing protein [Acidobacteriota bacterium]